MIQLNFYLEGQQVSSTVTEHRISKDLIEYQVAVKDEWFVREFGSPVFFKLDNNFFGFKDSQDKQGERAIKLLFAFKKALDWFKEKQPDIEI